MNTTSKEHLKLVGAARDLFMRIGIRSVSMDDIARELGISKKTLYQTVPNKEELVQLVLRVEIEEDVRMLERNRVESTDAIEELLRNSRYFVRQMRKVSPTTMHDLRKYYPEIFHNQVEAHQHHFLHQVEENLRRGKAEGLYREDIDPEVIANLYVGMTMMVVDRGIFPAQDRPLSDILWQHSTYHFFGIVNQAGRDRLNDYLQEEELC
ncbi:TetR/AcrR family transcriptional regulator [Neolewinella litorea]|uniref:TetR/AcrR family transcriptional regulator n=1 Tax=Neolewinella litorea TaxID=2562452 RepID=A0A4S4NJB2_9BACT|nr:TetR/AcrR family transcriptional regulator [Neolewinella litorea]THH39896.1 TetR/AcrR family transcriptional regulator [Neolewinella litorea]